MKYLSLLALMATAGFAQDFQAQYDQCVKDNGPINNGVVDYCAGTVADSADKAIKAKVKAIAKTIAADNSEEAAEDFTRFEDNWRQYRDQLCNYKGYYVGSPMYAYCPMEENIAHLAVLEELGF
ncbi:lysozyme inhibitor LprI family protein [Gallaecimonas xiamenensis]|uniref:Lysozyme inhibitor LprI-like N-terminal domain-containing protein n=1 Tax=Gallaecimonas xiamenensis 3-C-1 TaxID=745411 RepID=K2IZW3_9GAMM|nr:lysozyme inhibitor LprI family protein [Gallaecimonas xiamenensis]EKE68097.1 hypothetical protein B3C1_17412 [Gallaecimonas xiamenensis 3-C-1]